MVASNPDEWCEKNLKEAPATSTIDWISRDESTLFEIQAKPQGFRGLNDGLIKLAAALRENPKARRGCLVIDATGMTIGKTEKQWRSLTPLFAEDIEGRLAIIMIRKSKSWVIPEEPFLMQAAASIPGNSKFGFQQPGHSRNLPAVDKKLEITKVLMVRWLQGQGAIGIGELARHVGCSYPTVRAALNSLAGFGCLSEETRPAVELAGLPGSLWNHVVALSLNRRIPTRYCDRSGQKFDPTGLLTRLNRLAPDNVALGGVIAARAWQPDFDLNGTPRIDLVVHCPDQHLNLDFVTRLDPALEKTSDPNQSAVLVVHTIGRAVPDFAPSTVQELPVADPVETALDLVELGLTRQAGSLLDHFRKEARLK